MIAFRKGHARLVDVDGDSVYGVVRERASPDDRPDPVHAFSPHAPTDDYASSLPRLGRRPTNASVERLTSDYYETEDDEFTAPDEVWLRVRHPSNATYLINHANEDLFPEHWHTYDVIVDGDDRTEGIWPVLDGDVQRFGTTDDLDGDFGDATVLNAGVGNVAPVSEDRHPVSDIYYDDLLVDDGDETVTHTFPVPAQRGSGGIVDTGGT